VRTSAWRPRVSLDVPEGPIAWRQGLPERRWFVSQNLNNF
jgi:hypothetical protein